LVIFISNFVSADTRFNITDLGTLGGEWTHATSINDWGQIVGGSRDTTETWHPILWENGTENNLNIIGEAYSINNSGVIVGWEDRTESQAFVWEDGVVTHL
jgi:probable HAF family extracellular repeat protein